MSLVGTHRYTRKVIARHFSYVGGAVPGKFGWCFGTDLNNPLQVSSSLDTVTAESDTTGNEETVAQVFGVMPEPLANAELTPFRYSASYQTPSGAWMDTRESHMSSRGTASAATATLRRPMTAEQAAEDAVFTLLKSAMPTIWVEMAEDPGDGQFALLWPYSGNLYHGFWFIPRSDIVIAVTYDSATRTTTNLKRWKKTMLPLGSFTTLRLLQVGTQPVLTGNGQYLTFPMASTVQSALQVHYHVGRSGVPGNFWVGVAPTLWARQRMTLRYKASSPYDNSWVDGATTRHRMIYSNYGVQVSSDYDAVQPETLVVTIDSSNATEYEAASGFTANYAVLFRHEGYTTATLYADTGAYTLLDAPPDSLQLVLDSRARGTFTSDTALAYPFIEVEEILHASDNDTTGTIQKQTIWAYTNMQHSQDEAGDPNATAIITVRGLDDLLRRFSCEFVPHPVDWTLQEYIRYVLHACGIRASSFFYDYAGGEVTVTNDPLNYDQFHPDKFTDPFELIEKVAKYYGLLFCWTGSVFVLMARSYSTTWNVLYSSTFVSPVSTVSNDRYDYSNLAKIYDQDSHESYWVGALQLLDTTATDFYPFPVTREMQSEELAAVGRQPLSLILITLIGNYSVGELVQLSGYPLYGAYDINKLYRIESMRIEGAPGYCTLCLQERLSETV